MDLGLRGKTALVTGSSRGIGLAIAQALAHEGCNVALNARNAPDLLEAQRSIQSPTSAHVADVMHQAGAQSLIAAVVERWSGIDILICNVGSGASVAPGLETEDEWRRVMDVNLFSATATIAAARNVMRNADGGRSIVTISSICGLAALGAPVTYSAAKAALNATVRGLARPLARDGIRINAVAPGNILFDGGTWARKLAESPRAVADMLDRDVALRRLGTPAEIADLVVFLASPRAAFVTGAIFVADGGQLRA